jgi:hypothetical protein
VVVPPFCTAAIADDQFVYLFCSRAAGSMLICAGVSLSYDHILVDC